MKRKTWWGILAFLPIGFLFYVFMLLPMVSDYLPTSITQTPLIVYSWMILGLLAGIACMVYFFHSLLNCKLEIAIRLVWAFVIVLFPVITIPAYWFININKKSE